MDIKVGDTVYFYKHARTDYSFHEGTVRIVNDNGVYEIETSGPLYWYIFAERVASTKDELMHLFRMEMGAVQSFIDNDTERLNNMKKILDEYEREKKNA